MGYLDGKTLNDLTPVSQEGGKSNLIEPTDAEKWSMVELLLLGKGPKEIKKSVRRVVGEAKRGFSYAQIKVVEAEWKAKLAELTPKPEEKEGI